MKTLRSALLCALTLLPHTTTLSEAIPIEVRGEVLNAGPLALPAKSRLLDALRQARPTPGAFWFGGAFTHRSELPRQAAAKARLLAALEDRIKSDEPETALCLTAWLARLRKLPVTGRIPAVMDPAQLELQARANRRLQAGDSLHLPLRPTQVTVVGMVAGEVKLPFKHGRLTAEYLEQTPTCDGADPSHAWLVYPNGDTRRVGIAYWNEEPVSLTPGTRIYVPLAPSLWGDDGYDVNTATADFLATQPLP